MPTLNYWVCESLNDASAYNVRALTRREAARQRQGRYRPETYSPPYKVHVKYANSFDLLDQCLTEAGPNWETSMQNTSGPYGDGGAP